MKKVFVFLFLLATSVSVYGGYEEMYQTCDDLVQKPIQHLMTGKFISFMNECLEEMKDKGAEKTEAIEKCSVGIEFVRQKMKECSRRYASDLCQTKFASIQRYITSTLNYLHDVCQSDSPPFFPQDIIHAKAADTVLREKNPGTTYSCMNHSGTLNAQGTEVTFQNDRFVSMKMLPRDGVTETVYAGIMGGWRVVLTSPTGHYVTYSVSCPYFFTISDINIPVNFQKEFVFVAENEGIKVDQKAFIQMLNEYLTHTIAGAPGGYKNIHAVLDYLVIDDTVRQAVVDGMKEYFTYDRYLTNLRKEVKK